MMNAIRVVTMVILMLFASVTFAFRPLNFDRTNLYNCKKFKIKSKNSMPIMTLQTDAKPIESISIQPFFQLNSLKLLNASIKAFKYMKTTDSIKRILSLIAFMLSFLPLKAIAAETKKKVATAVVKKKVPLWRKILEGSNSTGAFKNWEVGDSRADFSALLNFASSMVIMGGIFLLGTLLTVKNEWKWKNNYVNETRRVQEYKENMYFDAVQEILTKLADSKTKGSTRARLQNELKELDPKGVIQKYITDGGERPDISDLTNQKPEKKSKPKKPNPPASTSSAKTSPVKPSSDSNTDKYTKVLDKLSKSLEDEMPSNLRKKLIDYLQKRFSSVKDTAKLTKALTKIEERIGDTEYWLEYYDKNNL